MNPQIRPDTGLQYALQKLDRLLRFPVLRIALVAALVGCAGVRVTPLNPDETVKVGAKEGMRYYMPAPYLLVARMPPLPPTEPADSEDASSEAQSAEANKSSTPSPPRNTGSASKPPSTAPAGGAPSSNTSFLASTPQYMLKLIYLPDKTKPMAMSVRTGLFGTASMKPGLQDGWMLNSLDASADSKAAETLTAIASLVSSATTGGAGAAAKVKTTPKGEKLAGKVPEIPPDFSSQILKPGLYKFVYDDANGQLIGLHAVTFFADTGVTSDVGDVTARAAYAHRSSGK